jgi:hypothetical protein
MPRGVLYIKWGQRHDGVLQRSLASLRAIHPELPVHIHQLPDQANLLDKAGMFQYSPFEQTLFLDADTVVMDRLDFGFEMADRHALACCICECPWARRYTGIGLGDLVEYNTGVLFFTKEAQPVFDAWNINVRQVDSSMRFIKDERLFIMPCNDQAGFSLAVAQMRTPPFVLPMNWNLRTEWQRSWFGPVKVWHAVADPPADVVAWTRQQSQSDAVIQYARFNNPK